jgi:hypothetical protein
VPRTLIQGEADVVGQLVQLEAEVRSHEVDGEVEEAQALHGAPYIREFCLAFVCKGLHWHGFD